MDNVALAQVWMGGNEFALREVQLPELKADELLVTLEAATVCGSDRHTVSGRRTAACPSILGHEGVGRVVASRRTGIAEGARVVFSIMSTCGGCPRCQHGFSAKCKHVAKVGHEAFDGPWPLSGTYATHIHVLAGQTVRVIDESVPDAAASVVCCAVATVMAVFEAAGDIEDREVLVNGVGMLGLVALAEARRRGAGRVVGCDPAGTSFEVAEGFADTLVRSVDGIQADVVLELSGARAGVAGALGALDLGGTAVLAGSVAPAGTVDLDPEWVVRGWRTIRGVHNYEPRHLVEAVELVTYHGLHLDWDAICGEPIGLADLPAELAAQKSVARRLVRF